MFDWIVCSDLQSLPDVEIQSHQPHYITAKLHERIVINCTITSIESTGKVEWKYNDRTLTSSDSEVISNMYKHESCSLISTITINNFTTANEGLYTCNASQPHRNYRSDSVYVLRGKNMIVT